MLLATKIVSRGKITKNEYTERASYLINLSLFQQSKYTRNFRSLNAMCNAAHLAEYTFASLPSLRRSKNCETCDYCNERDFKTISVNVNVLLHKGFQHIQEAIDDVIMSKQICIKCSNSCHVTEKYGPQIIIDTSIVTDEEYLKHIGLEATTLSFSLQNIAKNIKIGDNKYVLRGVVNYIKNASHYTALLFTNVSWYEYDDLTLKRVQVSSTKYMVMPHVLIYAQENKT